MLAVEALESQTRAFSVLHLQSSCFWVPCVLCRLSPFSPFTSLPVRDIWILLTHGSVVSLLFPSCSTGIFILNLVCRDVELKDSVLAGLKAAFPLLYVRRIEGEVNEILFCQLQPEQKRATPELLEMAQALEQTLRKPGQSWDDTYVLSDMLKTVKIV